MNKALGLVIAKSQQRGVVLITSLIFILVITLMGFAGMETSIQQEKMAGNMRNKQMAFQGAEAALLAAQEYLESSVLDSFNGTNGLYQKTTNGSVRWEDMSAVDWQDPTKVVLYSSGFQELSEQPSYFIETYELGGDSDSLDLTKAVDDFQYYRITARARGQSPTALVILQSVYRR